MGPPGFRILCLDGGGIRGAFIAGVLAEVERKANKRVGDCFDLIAGTSTGGIIAIALALGEPAERIEEFYAEKGTSCFERDNDAPRPGIGYRLISKLLAKWTPGGDFDADWLTRCKYKSQPLRDALGSLLTDRKIGQATQRLVIPAVDLTKGQTVVFKTSHLPGLVRDADLSAVDVAMATSAAPTYFPSSVMRPGSAYADGGLWANNPALVAIAESIRINKLCHRPGLDPQFELDEIRMLSIGTGRPSFFIRPPQQAGILFWATQILEITGDTQSQGTDFAAKYILGESYKRIDFNLPSQARSKWSLDATDLTSQLIHIGHEKAVEELTDINRRFLQSVAPRYSPFT